MRKLNVHNPSSSGSRGEMAPCPARAPDSITAKTVRRRSKHVRRSSPTCADPHRHRSTAAHVLASGAIRMAWGRSLNVLYAANSTVSCLTMLMVTHSDTRAMAHVVGGDHEHIFQRVIVLNHLSCQHTPRAAVCIVLFYVYSRVIHCLDDQCRPNRVHTHYSIVWRSRLSF